MTSNISVFNNTYRGKRVFVTGHTGFKGSWLTTWLHMLGAEIIGYSNEIKTNPSLFDEADLYKITDHQIGDIRDFHSLRKSLLNAQPDFVFHLAAQSIVSKSYSDPLSTLQTNILGTANLLEVLKELKHKCTVIIITSDKCYDNVEWLWGYKETDTLGGKDIYSSSKASAELVFKSYWQSFFYHPNCNIRLATGRAGNVIGGGDWAQDRIVADCMRCWSVGRPVEIRSPDSTRPWQHVLEPLSGYLHLGSKLTLSCELSGESFNFGPQPSQDKTVLDLILSLSKPWGFEKNDNIFKVQGGERIFSEANLLKLNCDKSLFQLKWQPTLNYYQCVDLVGDWYYGFYNLNKSPYGMMINQINKFVETAAQKKSVWTK